MAVMFALFYILLFFTGATNYGLWIEALLLLNKPRYTRGSIALAVGDSLASLYNI